MSELFDTIEMKALDAAERERIAQEQKLMEHKRAVLAKRHKATRTVLLRIGGAVLVCLALWLAGKFELMNVNLVLCLYAAIFSWLCLWIGGWVQFMFCKGGLFEC